MRYLTAGDVLRIHEAEVSPRPTVDIGLLESAVLRPMETVGGRDAYPDIHAKAAALFHSLIRNHPFVDGNKRTAVLALVVFYNLNGFELDATDDEMVTLAVEAAEGSLDVATIAGRLASWARPLLP